MRLAGYSLLWIVIAFVVACGGGGGGGGGLPAAAYSAAGTWTFDDPTDVLTVNFTSSSFPAGCGPSVGLETFVVVSVSATQMVWDDGGGTMLAWLRISVGAGLAGTWTMASDEATYTLTIIPGGSFTLTADSLDCGGSGDMGFAVGTWSYDGGLQVFSIVVTGETFPAGCGPALGPAAFDVTSLTSSTMTWDDTPPIVWTRLSTGAGPGGGWTMHRDGGTYQLIANPDGTFTLMGSGIDCVSCSGGDYGATGTWTYDGVTTVLATVFVDSCFPAGCGPTVGPMSFTVLSLTATEMVWDGGSDPDFVWSRTPGGVGLPGTWTMFRDGGTYELSLRSDGSFDLVALGVTCP